MDKQNKRVRKIIEAKERISETIRASPIVKSDTLSQLLEGEVLLKLENLQRTGSFKLRGAFNKMSLLSKQEKRNGIVACSAGNHAQGVAYAGEQLGIQTNIFMPLNAPKSKIDRTKRFGGTVTLFGKTFEETKHQSQIVVSESGKTFIHPYDDDDVINGQGTLGLEIVSEVPKFDVILVPIGGGGLIAGITTVIKELYPSIQVIGVQSENVHGMIHSIQKQSICAHRMDNTIADGCNVSIPGTKPFHVISNNLDGTVVVSEEEIRKAIEFLLQEEKTIAEGAGALTTAAILSGKAHKWIYKRKTVAIVSGGNIDNDLLKAII